MNDTPSLDELFQQAKRAQEWGAYEQAITIYSTILDQIENSPQPIQKEKRYRATEKIGRLYQQLGEHKVALRYYEQYYREADSEPDRINALIRLGEQWGELGDYRQSLAYYHQALDAAKKEQYVLSHARVLAGMGVTLYYLGRLNDSLQLLKQAQEIFTQANDLIGLDFTWAWLGVVYMDLGMLDKSIAAFKADLPLARQVSLPATAEILNDLGECYQILFDIETALTYHQEALNITQGLNLSSEGDITRNIGMDLYYLGQTEEALGYLRRALTLAERGSQDVQFQALYSLAIAEIHVGKPEKGHEYAILLQAMSRQYKATNHLAKALYVLGLYHQQQNQLEETEHIWQEAIFTAHEAGLYPLLWEIHAAMAQIITNPALARTHYRIAANVIEQMLEPIEDVTLRQKFLSATPVQIVMQNC